MIIPDKNWHVCGDRRLPRVTAITSMYPMGYGLRKFLGDAGSFREAEAVKDKAAIRGSKVHEMVACLLAGQAFTYSPEHEELWPYLESFVDWYADEGLKGTAYVSERFMWNTKLGFAGTADLVTADTIIDFKTGSTISLPEYALQVDAYRRLAEATDGKVYDRLLVVQLGASTKKGYSVREVKESRRDLKLAFDACKRLFHREHGTAPKDREYRDELYV